MNERIAPRTYPPFEPKIINGRVYGRGACDAEGSLAAMIYARLIFRVLSSERFSG